MSEPREFCDDHSQLWPCVHCELAAEKDRNMVGAEQLLQAKHDLEAEKAEKETFRQQIAENFDRIMSLVSQLDKEKAKLADAKLEIADLECSRRGHMEACLDAKTKSAKLREALERINNAVMSQHLTRDDLISFIKEQAWKALEAEVQG